MTPVTLVAGGTPHQRENAIAAVLSTLPQEGLVGLILEGLPASGSDLSEWPNGPLRSYVRIAAGCPCCMGNLSMRVNLDRLLRRRPQHLFIALSSEMHLPQMLAFLNAAPYDAHLSVGPVLQP